jgi:hypothetical protein
MQQFAYKQVASAQVASKPKRKLAKLASLRLHKMMRSKLAS